MTREQAEAKAAASRAAYLAGKSSTFLWVKKNVRLPGGYGLRDGEKLMREWRRHNVERMVTCYFREYRRQHLAQRAANNRAYRARKKAYLEELFSDSPVKRVHVSWPRPRQRAWRYTIGP
jgi:hypothetical protein